MNRILIVFLTIAATLALQAQGVKPLPSLHVDGKWIVDTHGNHVVLHGVMDTPNPYFNSYRWGWECNDNTVSSCLNYFEKLYNGLEQAKCDVFRLHLDPCWTNDPSKPRTGSETGEANISQYSQERLQKYLKSLYFPLAKRAMNHGMYVVVRPPGVCPGNLQVGDYYQDYLLDVWDTFTQNDSIKKYAGQISIELANEPVSVKTQDGQDNATALHDYFQPIVDKIRNNGFTGIIWVPGTGWQSNYTSFATNPITGYNIGYAVHDYTGWYGCSDSNANSENYIRQFRQQVPVVETAPIIITEVDWSPEKEGAGHYNEHGEWVPANYGTWSTGSTSKWGKAYKDLLDHYGNISMTLSGTACLIDIDHLINNNEVVPAFGGYEEACGKACMDWYAEYYQVDWAHADFKNVSSGDLGNGKYSNPVIMADFPDPDVIRVGDTYYYVSTTMSHFPGATILKSHDLVNWEYCAQPLTQLSTADNYNLTDGQNAYAQGMWACSMKYHDGTFYLLINGNDTGGWILTATDPEGKWEKQQLPRIYYDPGMLFDNGKVYIACGNTNIQMCELDMDFNQLKEQTVIRANDMLEGCHLYHIGEYYYIYATYGGWPSGQTVFRSKNIFGPYEEKMLMEKYINGKPNTVHQGALIDTPEGEWWTMLMEDVGAFGRMPSLQPVKWFNGWPIIGNNGVPVTTQTKPATAQAYPRSPLPTNDPFRSYPLGQQWEWNHNPDDGAWSLFDRPGWLRLRTSGTATRLTQARNMLTQRIFAYNDRPSTGTVKIDISHLGEGDIAGICVFQDPYAFIGVRVKDGVRQLIWRQDTLHKVSNFTPSEKLWPLQTDSIIYLRATANYADSKVQCYYSTDNVEFKSLGGTTTQSFNLSVFVGARFGLFCYATKEDSEGYADFDWFSTEPTYEESTFYPADFEGFSVNMLTAETMVAEKENIEVMIGNNASLQLNVTYRDGHTENVAAKAKYAIEGTEVIDIQNGLIKGKKEGVAQVTATYTDPMGNELSTQFAVRSTFFPFGSEYINTSLFAQGTYDEATHTFHPGQWGQMGWTYPNGADMSGYKYLVIKLAKKQNCDAHLNIFPQNSIWGDCYATAAFGSKTQIVTNLKTAKLTSGDHQGQALNTKDIHIVSFWTNGSGDLVVDDIYLTNNEDYSPETPSAITETDALPAAIVNVYSLSGVLLRSHVNNSDALSGLPAGIYIVGGQKRAVK